MSSKHHRQLALPRGEYFRPTENPADGDLACIHARRRIVTAIERSDIPRKLDDIVAHESDVGEILLALVDDWARRWRLADWMLVHGMLWHQWGGYASDLWLSRWDGMVADGSYASPANEGPPMASSQLASLHSEDFSLAIPGCDLTEISFRKWKQTIRSEVEKQFREIEEEFRSRAKAAGFVRTGRQPRTGEKRYYDWFVRFELGGETYEEIADRIGVPLQTVAEGVRSVADAARLSLRTGGKRGRPRRTERADVDTPAGRRHHLPK